MAGLDLDLRGDIEVVGSIFFCGGAPCGRWATQRIRCFGIGVAVAGLLIGATGAPAIAQKAGGVLKLSHFD
ncbi:MAG: hypothetical protein JO358_09390, partial [Alphaproteobacteria bacterium]|nr:hypothetical protein [Alphaproteobacteria bacterium]